MPTRATLVEGEIVILLQRYSSSLALELDYSGSVKINKIVTDSEVPGTCLCVCVCLCLFIKLHINAQSGTVISIIGFPSPHRSSQQGGIDDTYYETF